MIGVTGVSSSLPAPHPSTLTSKNPVSEAGSTPYPHAWMWTKTCVCGLLEAAQSGREQAGRRRCDHRCHVIGNRSPAPRMDAVPSAVAASRPTWAHGRMANRAEYSPQQGLLSATPTGLALARECLATGPA